METVEMEIVELLAVSIYYVRYTIVTAAYLVFWGPLFLVTLVHWRMDWTDARSSVTHQVYANNDGGGDDDGGGIGVGDDDEDDDGPLD